MLENLDLLARFWELKARHAASGTPLSDEEQVELLSLLALVAQKHEPSEIAETFLPSSYPVQLIGEGILVSAELRQLSADCLWVSTGEPMPTGSRVLIRATDAIVGQEIVIPCIVQSVDEGRNQGRANLLTLVPDGIPSKGAFANNWSAQRSFPLGARAKLVA
jgi:hypothetical protein